MAVGFRQPRPDPGYHEEVDEVMRMRGTRVPYVFFFCVGMLVLLSGCVSKELIRPEDLPAYQGDDIVIIRTDGKVVRFDGGDYSVDTLVGGVTVRGKGRAYTDRTRVRSVAYSDSISLQDMAGVEVHQKSIFYYTVPIIFVSAASIIGVFVVIWLLAGAPSLKQ
jgi:hypothetical protein